MSKETNNSKERQNEENRSKDSNLINKEIIKCFTLSLNIEDDLRNEIISELESNPELYISQDFKFTKKFAWKLIDNDEEGIIIQNLDKFEDLNAKMAIYIMWAWYYKDVIENLDKFEDGLSDKYKDEPSLEISNYEKIIEELLSWRGGLDILFNNIDKFDTVFIARKLIDHNQIEVVIHNLNKFADLDKEMAIDMMRAWYYKEVIENLDKFEDNVGVYGEFYGELVWEPEVVEELLLWRDGLNVLAMHINQFQSLNEYIAINLVEAGYSDLVIENLNRFAEIDFSKLAKKLIEMRNFIAVIDNLDKFEWVTMDMVNKFYSDFYE